MRYFFRSPCAAWLPWLLLLVLLARPALGQDIVIPDNPLADPDRWLSEERWSELRYGLSIREPHDPLRVPDTPLGEVIRWALPDGVRISLSFERGMYRGVNPEGRPIMMPVRLDALKKQLSDEMQAAVAGEVINTRADEVIEVGPLTGIINYYVIKPDPRNRAAQPMLFGVALIRLDDMAVAVLRLECPPNKLAQGVCTFACMVQSIQVQPIDEVNRRVNGWIENSEQLLASITQQDRLAAMRSDRLYRVLENGKDLGYVRVWQRFQDADYYKRLKQRDLERGGDGRLDGVDAFGVTGNALIMQSHFEGRGAVIERLYEAVDPTEGVGGYWQIKSRLTYANDPANRYAGAWVETGVRGVAEFGGERMDHVQVVREGTPPAHMVDFLLERERDPARRLRYPSANPKSLPSGDLVQTGWPVPRRAFLSPVDAQLVPALLPREEKTYAFTAYDIQNGYIDIRVMRVEPTADGGKTVHLRPVLDQSEQQLVFDRNNELTRWVYPDGREMRRTTREELARIWRVRLPD